MSLFFLKSAIIRYQLGLLLMWHVLRSAGLVAKLGDVPQRKNFMPHPNIN